MKRLIVFSLFVFAVGCGGAVENPGDDRAAATSAEAAKGTIVTQGGEGPWRPGGGGVEGCTTNSDCRAGYYCEPAHLPDPQGHCVPETPDDATSVEAPQSTIEPQGTGEDPWWPGGGHRGGGGGSPCSHMFCGAD